MQAVMHGIVCGLAALLPLAVCHAQDPAQQPQPQQQQQPAGQQQPKPEDIRSEAESDRSSRLTLRLKDRDLREVVASIRKKANANIIIDPSIEATVTIDLQDVPWRNALTLVAERIGKAMQLRELSVGHPSRRVSRNARRRTTRASSSTSAAARPSSSSAVASSPSASSRCGSAASGSRSASSGTEG